MVHIAILYILCLVPEGSYLTKSCACGGWSTQWIMPESGRHRRSEGRLSDTMLVDHVKRQTGDLPSLSPNRHMTASATPTDRSLPVGQVMYMFCAAGSCWTKLATFGSWHLKLREPTLPDPHFRRRSRGFSLSGCDSSSFWEGISMILELHSSSSSSVSRPNLPMRKRGKAEIVVGFALGSVSVSDRLQIRSMAKDSQSWGDGGINYARLIKGPRFRTVTGLCLGVSKRTDDVMVSTCRYHCKSIQWHCPWGFLSRAKKLIRM